jgi:hypothetical protein
VVALAAHDRVTRYGAATGQTTKTIQDRGPVDRLSQLDHDLTRLAGWFQIYGRYRFRDLVLVPDLAIRKSLSLLFSGTSPGTDGFWLDPVRMAF